jgi:hypothetical protein
MSKSLLENVRLAINPKFQEWVLFQNGTYIIFNDTDTIESIEKEAIKQMRQFGPVHIGSPAGDFGVQQLNKTEGWSVSGHGYGMYTYVNPSELPSQNPNDNEIGLVGRDKRNRDGLNPVIMHINKKDWLDVKLIAGFLGIKQIPLPFVLGINNANPKLFLKKDHYEYRGAFMSRKGLYENIERVDIFLARRTTNVVIWKNSIFTFVGNTDSDSELRKCLEFLKEKQCRLTQKAMDFLEQ